MLSKNQLKYITSLHQKKFRKEHHCFVAEGSKVVIDILSSTFKTKVVYALKEWIAINKTLIPLGIELIEINEKELQRISELSSPNQVLSIVEIPECTLTIFELKNQFCFLLDDIKDPGNMGTIIRLADWFGISNIVASPGSVDCFNSKVVQASMGSVTRVKVHYLDLNEAIIELKNEGIKILGSSLNGENIYTTSHMESGAILLGNESKGANDSLLNLCDKNLFIPSFNTSLQKAESLNVAIAAAVMCSELIGNKSRKI